MPCAKPVVPNVGIGTTVPGTMLDVSGNIRMSAGTPEFEMNSGGPRVRVPAGNTIAFHTGGGIGSATLERMRIDSSGNVGIGTTGPTSLLHVAGTVQLGTAGTSFTSAGVCTIASTAITNSAATYTCTGVPASTAVAVACSGAAAMQTPNSNSIYCRANGTLNQVICNTTTGNNVAMTWNCMWMKL